ncbi:MAG: ABC transporter permease subunit, partial [Firmicutes bacterium]|nr:ABC transporter permease subunit [Bacillota bacterium]
MKNSIFRNQKYIRWLVLVIWLVIWYVAAHLVGSGLILPGPHATLMALLKLLKTKTFYFNVLWTLLRTVIGIAVSFVLGAAFAVLADRSMPVREFLRLPVNFFKSIPVMAIIIYVILIVRSDWVAVVVCFLMCFPIAYTNILNGLEAIDVKYRELGAVLGLGSGQMTRFVIRPSLEPQIKAALSLITAMSWKVVVASEVLAIPKFSIGYQML